MILQIEIDPYVHHSQFLGELIAGYLHATGEKENLSPINQNLLTVLMADGYLPESALEQIAEMKKNAEGDVATLVAKLLGKVVLKDMEYNSLEEYNAAVANLLKAAASGIYHLMPKGMPQMIPHVVVIAAAPFPDREGSELMTVNTHVAGGDEGNTADLLKIVLVKMEMDMTEIPYPLMGKGGTA